MTNAERILAAYAEAEPWKADHDAAMHCFEVEEAIAVGNLAFHLVSFVDTAWQEHVSAGDRPFREEDDRQIGGLYQTWVGISERWLDGIERLSRDGFNIKGVDEFLIHLEEARSLLEARALESGMRPIEDILPLVRGNPRPERYGK